MSASFLAADVERFYRRELMRQQSRIHELEEALSALLDDYEAAAAEWHDDSEKQARMLISIARAALAKAEGK